MKNHCTLPCERLLVQGCAGGYQVVGHTLAGLAPVLAVQHDRGVLGALEAVDAHHRAAVRRPAQPAPTHPKQFQLFHT